MLQDRVIGIYCLPDDILKGMGHYEGSHRQVSDSEMSKTALVAALYFKGNHSDAVNNLPPSSEQLFFLLAACDRRLISINVCRNKCVADGFFVFFNCF